MNNDTPKTNRQGHREALTTAIMLRVQSEIEAVIATLPLEEPERVREAIRSEVFPHARFKLGALTLAELTSEEAVQPVIKNHIATARYFVDRVTAKRNRP